MKRTDSLIRGISFLIFIALACYISYYLYDSWKNPFRTAQARAVSVDSSVECRGYVVRDEQALWVSGDYFSFEIDDGQKVHAGQTIAAVYEGEAAYARAEQRRELLLQRESIAAIMAHSSSGTAVYDRLIAVSRGARTGDSVAMESASVGLETLLMTQGADLQALLEDIDLQLEQIDAASRGDTDYVTAAEAGVFSAASDGFERVGTDSVAGLSPADLNALFSTAAPGDAKLVTGIGWSYAAVIGLEHLDQLKLGDTVQLRFDLLNGAGFQLQISHIGSPDENGQCVVVFSSRRDLEKVLTLREEGATIVLSSFSGVAIPEEAILHDKNGQTFIYVISGLQARRVDVEVVSVADGTATVSSDSRLLVGGAQVIVQASELYDGKVGG